MNRTISSRLRRFGVAAALAGTALAGVLVAAPGTASAGPSNRCFLDGDLWQSAGTVQGYLNRECVNPESVIGMNMTIQRLDWATGVWSDVASGRGHATYVCAGTSSNYFRITGYETMGYRLFDCS
jgi:hypothetical protein